MSAKRKPAGSGDDDKASREEPSAKKLKGQPGEQNHLACMLINAWYGGL